jgi:hypothetical protein
MALPCEVMLETRSSQVCHQILHADNSELALPPNYQFSVYF